MDNHSPTMTKGAKGSLFLTLAPFFMPFLFFQSGFLALLSPLPLFFVSYKRSFSEAGLAFLGNLGLLVGINTILKTDALENALVAGLIWFSAGLLMPILIRKTGRIRASISFSYLFSIAVIYGILAFTSLKQNQGVVEFATHLIHERIEELMLLDTGTSKNRLKTVIEQTGRVEFEQQTLEFLPSAIILGLLGLFWINLLFGSRLIPDLVTPKFWTDYRLPDWVIAPALLSVAGYVFGKFAIYYVSLNLFHFFAALYLLQGFSIMASALNRMTVFGFFRTLIYGVLLFVAWPFVIVVGFFDHWFDFRKRIGQA